MMTDSELLALKARMITGADAAKRIATSTDPVVYDQEVYEAVYEALVNLPTDLSRMCAELDVLRGMTACGVSMFLVKEKEPSNGVREPRGDVAAVPDHQVGGGGGGEPTDAKGIGGGVQEGGVLGEPAARPKRRRTRARKGADQSEVGSGH